MNEEKKNNDDKKLIKTVILIAVFMAGYSLGSRRIIITDNRQ